MELTVNDAMSTAMWRFHDAALERAALIYTFARSTTTLGLQPDDLNAVKALLQLHDVLEAEGT